MTENKVFEIATLDDMTPAEMFISGALDPVIADIRAEVEAHVPDTTTKKGRDAVASLAHKVGKVAVRVDSGKKQLTSEWRKQTADVNAEGKKLDEQLRSLQKKAKAPLVEWQAEEDLRIAAEKILAEMQLAEAEAHYENDMHDLRKKNERKAEEFRKREQELAEKEAAVEAEKQKLLDDEAERVRLAEKAEADRLQAIKDEEERVERERLAGIAEEERVERERLAEIQRQKDEGDRIEAAKLKAIADEKQRQADVDALLFADKLKREENKRIVTRVHNKIVDSLVGIGVHPDKAIDVCDAISSGKIPKVSITY